LPDVAAPTRATGRAPSDASARQAMSTGLYMRIGSETKTFTVTAVLQLVDRHKLRLNDPIGRYVSGVPDGNDVATGTLLTRKTQAQRERS
jgi:D-alanyl-D-alanine carboxypeptidase